MSDAINLTHKLLKAVLAVSVSAASMIAALTPGQAFAAGKFTLLYTFTGGSDGEFPEAGLTIDTTNDTGALYGTTFGAFGSAPGKNCSKGCGNQYSFVNGHLSTNHSFHAGNDGAFPTGEVAVRKGTIYGTTERGGGSACGGSGCGTAFLLPAKGGETVFRFCTYEFPACTKGALPHAGPILDGEGNAYGTTALGGTATGYECSSNFEGCGTVYMLTPTLGETVLYNFCSKSRCRDGSIPLGRLSRDDTGNLYGTTQFGGDYGAGTVFELQQTNGKYTHHVLYSFCQKNLTGCPDGAIPEAGVIEDKAGNLYGTASAGGGGGCEGSTPGCGVVYKLAPDGTYVVLHAFAGGKDGALPQAPLVVDGAGTLYGTTLKGGNGTDCKNKTEGCGTVFALTPDGTETPIYIFSSQSNGRQPEGALLLKNGYVYGAARVGGVSESKCDCGTLFKIKVAGMPPTGAWRSR